MCGIAGFWSVGQTEPAEAIVDRMLNAIRHRGPDGSGLWTEPDEGLALGHRRLAVVDLSEAGRQPMTSHSGRLVAVFNGEIYNHRALRSLIDAARPGIRWRGHSDTETLLEAIDAWGLEKALKECTGMFALALWNRQTKSLCLARDRFGEKPLYWTITRHGLLFGSELKAIMAAGWMERRLSRDAASMFLRLNNVPAPHSVFEGVNKLQPGHWLQIDGPTTAAESHPYWSIAEAWRAGRNAPFSGSDQEAIDRAAELLGTAIKDQMVADVPLGAFLSGGIDSSTVVALMQAQSARSVKTFSIGFHDQAYNEADAAKAVAAHLGTEHTEMYVSAADALDVIPKLPEMFCEPFADSSQIPTYLVAKMARQHVTVALSGDAGDEVFGGYNRYLFGPPLLNRVGAIPPAVRRTAAGVLNWLSPAQWNRAVSAFEFMIPKAARFSDPGLKIAKLSRALACEGSHGVYLSFLSQWMNPDSVVAGASTHMEEPDWSGEGLSQLGFAERMMVEDARGYLPNDILVKVDRAAMSVSLEGRIPFLDHRLYEFAASLPLQFKIRNGVTKWIVRQVLNKHVPPALVDRPKVGFGVPLEHWLRNELRDWAESLLSTAALNASNMFDPKIVQAAWRSHLSGRENLQHPIWCVLMYQAWHEQWIAR